MEPFDIRSTPAKLGIGYVVLMGVCLVATLLAAWSVGRFSVGVLLDLDDSRTPGGIAIAGAGVLLVGMMAWPLYPQVLVLRRYFGEDRGRQVLTFRLDQDGWRWLQVGTHVLLPWDGLKVSVAERHPDKIMVRIEHHAPVRCADDRLSRKVHWNLRNRPVTTIPFTLVDPTEDELADAITTQSAGRVVLER